MKSSRFMLTPEEQGACLMLGAVLKSAEYCLPLESLVAALQELPTEKVAAPVMPSDLTKTVVTMSVLTGLPIGIAGHLISRKINERSQKERELTLRRDFYTEAVRNLASNLPAAAKA